MKIVVAAALMIAFSILTNGYSDSYQMAEDGPEVGEDAPDFTLIGLDGKEVTLSSLKQTKPVVLIFGSCT